MKKTKENYYINIKTIIINDVTFEKVKDYSINQHRLQTYYEVGKTIAEAGKHYGEGIIKEFSIKLTNDLGEKYSYRVLYKMLKLYNYYKNAKVPTLSAKLTWSHYDELLSIKDNNKIEYYINKCENNNLSVRQLREAIKTKEYERLPENTKSKLIKNEEPSIKDLVPNPIIIENKNNIEIVNEKILHNLILENLEDFMNQLGNGYSFIKSEYQIKLGNNYNYLDLLLFNYEFNCFVVVELKVTELKKEHIGQIEVYMNYIDNNLKKIYHDKTIGIIICKKHNKYIIEYASDERILSREYLIV